MNNNKPTITQTVVVEGKTDTIKLQKLFNVNTIETGGFCLSEQTLNMIMQANAKTGIILCLDPDGTGDQLRKKILDKLNNQCLNVFLNKQDMEINAKKIGIAQAKDMVLIEAFKHLVELNSNLKQTITWAEYIALDLHNTKVRKFITDHYHIMECNHKRLFKCLNMLHIDQAELKKILAIYLAADFKK